MKKEFKDSVEEIELVIESAAAIAIAESKALDLPITYLKNGKIIKEYPNGKIEVLEKLEKNKKPSNGFKKGQTIHVKKEC